jgi:glycosyltransferase involved in cell wall biosynthesis
VYEISAIIPTTGRPDLCQALLSAKGQEGTRVETVVACDTDRVPQVVEGMFPHIDVLLLTGGGRGAAFARNLAVHHSSAPWVAYLDDDGTWLPGKSLAQLEVARELLCEGWEPVVSSRVYQRSPGRPPSRVATPRMLIGSGQSPESYLFRGRRPGSHRAMLAIPTLLTRREFALRLPWNAGLSRHQDWELLVQAHRVPGTRIVQLAQATATVGSPGSMSAGADWRSSLEWARSWSQSWDPVVTSDFLMSQVLRYALQERDLHAAVAVLTEASRHAMPCPMALLSASASVLPRGFLERVALFDRFRWGGSAPGALGVGGRECA